jgi:hypothetical protein
VSGTYLEACNCEAICPCRTVGAVKGGRSTYGVCDFALSWRILGGDAAGLDLSGLSVAMAGSYSDDESGSPWRVVLYLDERGDDRQREALTEIFLGRAGGTALENYAHYVGEVYAVRPARIELEHSPGRRRIRAGDYVAVEGFRSFAPGEQISCGIPGHDRPGEELVGELQRVDDGALRWEVRGRCGFATDFDYRS